MISPSILEEFDRVMKLPRLKRYISAKKLQRFRRLLRSRATVVIPKTRFDQLTPDSNDNIFVETAFDGKAKYLVSGDRHLLSLKEFQRTRIVTADEMLTSL